MSATTAQACLVQCLTPLRLRLLQCACLAPLISLGPLLQLSCALSRLEEAACRVDAAAVCPMVAFRQHVCCVRLDDLARPT